MSFIIELKRRNVIRVGIAYSLVAWVVLQIVDFLTELIDAPAWVLQLLFILAAIGLLIVLTISWVYELTPEGIKKESEIDRSRSITPDTGRKLDRVIIIFLALAVVVLVGERFIRSPATTVTQTAGSTEAASAIDDKANTETLKMERSVAVLPFIAMSSGPDDEFFSDGLTEEILNSLAQLPELLVTARTSAFSFKGQDIPVNEIAATLGVNHIVEGSVRRSGDRIRVTAQLIRADDGFHLWSDNYDATSEDTIAVQEDIAEQIAVALNVILDDSKRQAMQLAGLRNVEAFTKYQEARYKYQVAHGEADTVPLLREANVLIEEVLEMVPGFAQAWVEHSDLYAHFLLDHLAGGSHPSVTQEEIDSALKMAVHDYTQAIKYARNDSERKSFEYDLAFLSGNWQGIPGRIQTVLADDGCTTNNWMPPMASLFGFANEYVRYSNQIRLCDPLVSIEWFNEARALFWAGELEASLAVAEEANQVAPGGWLNLQTVYTLAALSRYEDAERLILTRMQHPLDSALSRLFVAGAKGDRNLIEQRMQEYSAIPDSYSGLFQMGYYVMTGQRDKSNEMVALLDQEPAGHYGITMHVLWCACGAPFDLDYAPNYAAKLQQAGLNWPPPSPINFPLKTW